MAKLVAEVYADALFEVASENQTTDSIFAEFENFAELLREDGDFWELLRSPKISKEEKIQLLDKIFSEQYSQYFLNFLKVIVEKRRANEFLNIYSVYRNLYRDVAKIETAYIKSAVELTEEQKKVLIANLEKSTGKTIEPVYSVEPALIGGIVIKIGYQMIDHSVSKGISDLKAMLIDKVV